MKMKKTLLVAMAMVLFSAQLIAQEDDLGEMSLEELMNMEITSVSKKAERIQDVSSAISVITAEDIVQSGATNLHEALRMVPGYYGVQDSYSSVLASIRNSPTPSSDAGTVLYLLDGTPIQDLMGSVFSFANFDIPLDEIDRIEVIKGSGGTIYGANSATGVVNIFTKNPEDYDGINARVEGADPGYIAASVRAGGKLSEKLAISGYGKFRSFSGWDSMAGKDENGNETVSESVFTKNSDESKYYSIGAKLNFNISESSKLSARMHYNGREKTDYTSVFGSNFMFTLDDQVFENDVKASRLVANLRYDYSFSETHSLFVRVSTNREDDFYRIGGGMNISNSIVDFEIQDNFQIGEFNDLSIGANLRMAKFDVHDINDTNSVNYVDPQANETIKGAFIQDKISLLDGGLFFTLGVKAENYTLINDEYYFSPMAKFSVKANDNISIWGGYTRSYTTPGFNNSNIDLSVFQAPTAEAWSQVIAGQVTEGVRQGVYANAIANGADDATATAMAEGFLATEAGQLAVQNAIASAAQGRVAAVPNVGLKNGTHTVPTQFQTMELGVKSNFGEKVQMNLSVFKTFIKDAVAANIGGQLVTGEPSITNPARTTNYLLYGNYVKGESNGFELVVKYFPLSNLFLEGSLSMNKTDYNYQENKDFELTDDLNESRLQGTSVIPEQVYRFRANYKFGKGFNATASLLHASISKTEASYVHGLERYVNPFELQLPAGPNSPEMTTVAKNSTRTIVNLRLEKKLLEDKLSVYVFGNDITNKGIVADTEDLRNATLHQIGAMFGLGLNYKLK